VVTVLRTSSAPTTAVSARTRCRPSQRRELADLLNLRDAALSLLKAESDPTATEPLVTEHRQVLNDRYDRYLDRHGPLNRYSWRRTGRTDPDTGQDKLARARPAHGGFRDDPYAPVVYALEVFNDATHTAGKADIFRQRVVAPAIERDRPDSPRDALAICLDTHGDVRLPEIARLLDTTTEP
jgi:N12 class adenine-specific DNA methylase